MIRKVYWSIALVMLFGCSEKYSPDNYFSSEKEKELLVDFLLPYVLPKPDNITFDARFSDSVKVSYQEEAKKDSLFLRSYYIDPNDSLHYFLVQRRDRKSLFVDYRAIAGVYKLKNGKREEMELKFLTTMMRKDTIEEKASILFHELITKGNIDNYIGNRAYVDWPSQDVYYSKAAKMWKLKADSEWAQLMNEARKTE